VDSTRLWTELRANVFTVPSFDVDGLTLYYETRGTGPAVVLLHGFTSRGTSWTRLGWLDPLAESGFQAIAPDARSHGRSGRIYEPALCSTEKLAADVLALLDHLGVRSAALFGFSMGGGTALRAAMDKPERVKAVVVGGVGDSALNQRPIRSSSTFEGAG
jgi:pimeloyl-ACP methyl ester carboxylesterase